MLGLVAAAAADDDDDGGRAVAPTPAGPAMAGPVFVNLGFAHAQYSYLLLLVQLRLS